MIDVNTESLQRQFAKMGADLEVVELAAPEEVVNRTHTGKVRSRWVPRRPAAFNANVVGTGKRERFRFTVFPDDLKHLQIVDVDAKGRHLLVSVQALDPEGKTQPEPQKMLMGHDEMHWFVAAVPRSSVTVAAAKEALKPTVVKEAQKKAKVRRKNRHKRRQETFIRQGEWFFMPVPDFVVDPKLILKKEPIRRGRMGKPHICEELYRRGGRTVMVSDKFPNGISMERYGAMTQQERRSHGFWRQMASDPVTYVRGKVTHPDHHTVTLQGWHRVVMNTEANVLRATGVVVSFLD